MNVISRSSCIYIYSSSANNLIPSTSCRQFNSWVSGSNFHFWNSSLFYCFCLTSKWPSFRSLNYWNSALLMHTLSLAISVSTPTLQTSLLVRNLLQTPILLAERYAVYQQLKEISSHQLLGHKRFHNYNISRSRRRIPASGGWIASPTREEKTKWWSKLPIHEIVSPEVSPKYQF